MRAAGAAGQVEPPEAAATEGTGEAATRTRRNEEDIPLLGAPRTKSAVNATDATGDAFATAGQWAGGAAVDSGQAIGGFAVDAGQAIGGVGGDVGSAIGDVAGAIGSVLGF